MQFLSLALLATTATATAVNQAFTIRAASVPGSAIDNAPVVAVKSNLFLNKAQDATCDEPSSGATFYINEDGALELYRRSATPQWAYVVQDMGRGIIGYTTGAEPAPKNGQRNGWEVVDGQLKFKGQGLHACPADKAGALILYVGDASDSDTANTEGCYYFSANVVEMPNPVSCLYSE